MKKVFVAVVVGAVGVMLSGCAGIKKDLSEGRTTMYASGEKVFDGRVLHTEDGWRGFSSYSFPDLRLGDMGATTQHNTVIFKENGQLLIYLRGHGNATYFVNATKTKTKTETESTGLSRRYGLRYDLASETLHPLADDLEPRTWKFKDARFPAMLSAIAQNPAEWGRYYNLLQKDLGARKKKVLENAEKLQAAEEDFYAKVTRNNSSETEKLSLREMERGLLDAAAIAHRELSARAPVNALTRLEEIDISKQWKGSFDWRGKIATYKQEKDVLIFKDAEEYLAKKRLEHKLLNGTEREDDYAFDERRAPVALYDRNLGLVTYDTGAKIILVPEARELMSKIQSLSEEEVKRLHSLLKAKIVKYDYRATDRQALRAGLIDALTTGEDSDVWFVLDQSPDIMATLYKYTDMVTKPTDIKKVNALRSKMGMSGAVATAFPSYVFKHAAGTDSRIPETIAAKIMEELRNPLLQKQILRAINEKKAR